MARRGRPTKDPKPGQKASLGLKVTADLKKRLEMAAKQSGRTQSQEAEVRLERTFTDDDLAARIEQKFARLESTVSKALLMVPMNDEEKLQFALSEARRISDRLESKRQRDRPIDLASPANARKARTK